MYLWLFCLLLGLFSFCWVALPSLGMRAFCLVLMYFVFNWYHRKKCYNTWHHHNHWSLNTFQVFILLRSGGALSPWCERYIVSELSSQWSEIYSVLWLCCCCSCFSWSPVPCDCHSLGKNYAGSQGLTFSNSNCFDCFHKPPLYSFLLCLINSHCSSSNCYNIPRGSPKY